MCCNHNVAEVTYAALLHETSWISILLFDMSITELTI